MHLQTHLGSAFGPPPPALWGTSHRQGGAPRGPQQQLCSGVGGAVRGRSARRRQGLQHAAVAGFPACGWLLLQAGDAWAISVQRPRIGAPRLLADSSFPALHGGPRGAVRGEQGRWKSSKLCRRPLLQAGWPLVGWAWCMQHPGEQGRRGAAASPWRSSFAPLSLLPACLQTASACICFVAAGCGLTCTGLGLLDMFHGQPQALMVWLLRCPSFLPVHACDLMPALTARPPPFWLPVFALRLVSASCLCFVQGSPGRLPLCPCWPLCLLVCLLCFRLSGLF